MKKNGSAAETRAAKARIDEAMNVPMNALRIISVFPMTTASSNALPSLTHLIPARNRTPSSSSAKAATRIA